MFPGDDVPTFSHRHAHDSQHDALAWHLETLHDTLVEVVLRDGTRCRVTVSTHRANGWSEVDRRAGAVHLSPLGWVQLADVVCVVGGNRPAARW